MKTVVSDSASVLERAAESICAVLKEKPDAAITMAAGRTMLPLWARLGELVRRGELSLSGARFFQTGEFIDAPADLTLRLMTEEKLLAVTDLKPEHCFWLDEKNLADCDEAIAKAGGLDLAVLGLGNNAHIGFNEPATQYDNRPRSLIPAAGSRSSPPGLGNSTAGCSARRRRSRKRPVPSEFTRWRRQRQSWCLRSAKKRHRRCFKCCILSDDAHSLPPPRAHTHT